jgi:hypothetical protein
MTTHATTAGAWHPHERQARTPPAHFTHEHHDSTTTTTVATTVATNQHVISITTTTTTNHQTEKGEDPKVHHASDP